MNKRTIIAALAIAVLALQAAAQGPVISDTAFSIPGANYYSLSSNGLIDSTDEVFKLIDVIYSDPSVDLTVRNWLIDHRVNYKKGRTALVVVQHKISFSNTGQEQDEADKITVQKDSLNQLYRKLQVQRKLTDSCMIELQKKINTGKPSNTIEILNYYQESLVRLDSAIANVQKSWVALQPSWEEDKSVYSYVSYYDRFARNAVADYTAYLSANDVDVAYLIIGKAGKLDCAQFTLSQKADPTETELAQSVSLMSKLLAGSTVFTDGKNLNGINKTIAKENEALTFSQYFDEKSSIEMRDSLTDNAMKLTVVVKDAWIELEQIRSQAAGINPRDKDALKTICTMINYTPASLENTTLKPIKLQLVRFKANELKRNEKISMHIPGDDKSYDLEFHRTKCFSIRAGILGAMIERKMFELDSNKLYIKNDTLRGKKFWTNGFLVLECYPRCFGPWFRNDPDRFGPVWHPNSMVPWYYSRLGFYGGCRLSLHPQEAFIGGLSFLLTDAIHLHFGAMAYQMAVNQDGLVVSTYGDAAYWKENAPYKYKWYFSFGLSVSPSAFKDFSN